MRDVLIALVCLYFGVNNVIKLAEMPLGQWQLVQYLLALVTLLLLALGVYKAVCVVRAMAVAQTRAKDQMDQYRDEAAQQDDAASGGTVNTDDADAPDDDG